ncbi:MAG: SDR family oxidoreductase [Planctomycetes bacterium]|nr:SDR family oxidoreductase [Planctomycetota bacterium]
MRFAGKAALVSGAGSGIGRAIAEALLEEGARVVLFGRTLEKLEAVASRHPPDRTVAVQGRHEVPEEAARAVERALEAFGRLDVLVNNAGSFLGGTVGETSLEAWSESLAANLTGPFVLTRAALPQLRRERRGAVVNVASTLGLKPIARAAAYSVAKAGLIMLTRATALEEARNGVRANAVCPGVVDTPIHARRASGGPEGVAAFLEALGKQHPVGRIGKPEEVASAVLFLASEASAWTTGAVITIDGGISIA